MFVILNCRYKHVAFTFISFFGNVDVATIYMYCNQSAMTLHSALVGDGVVEGLLGAIAEL